MKKLTIGMAGFSVALGAIAADPTTVSEVLVASNTTFSQAFLIALLITGGLLALGIGKKVFKRAG